MSALPIWFSLSTTKVPKLWEELNPKTIGIFIMMRCPWINAVGLLTIQWCKPVCQLRILVPTSGPTAGCPASKRIFRDVTKWSVNLMCVYNENGCTVPGLGDRNGKRKSELGVKNNRCGKRVKGQGNSRINTPSVHWLHPDAIDSKKKIKTDT